MLALFFSSARISPLVIYSWPLSSGRLLAGGSDISWRKAPRLDHAEVRQSQNAYNIPTYTQEKRAPFDLLATLSGPFPK